MESQLLFYTTEIGNFFKYVFSFWLLCVGKGSFNDAFWMVAIFTKDVRLQLLED